MRKVDVERTLVFGCAHTPFQDRPAVAAMNDFIKYWKPNRIIINGDNHDLWACSKYFKSPKRKDTLQDEMDEARSFNSELRRVAGRNCEIVMNWGNHDYRYDRYLAEDAPKLLSLRDLTFERQFGLEESNIIPNRGKNGNYARMMLGAIKVGHFPIIRAKSAQTESSLVERYGISVIASHHHRKGLFYKTLGDGTSEKAPTVLMGIGTGTLADENLAGMEYVEDANWQKGFVIVEKLVEKDRYHVSDIPIIDGNILYDGRLF